MLTGKQLVKRYDGTEVLKGVDIVIAPGTITSLIGPSGSGKSTLLRILSMLELPESGTIEFEDASYRFPLAPEAIQPPWPKISVVFQSLFLWPHLTLLQNILLPIGGVKTKYVVELIKRLDMEEFIDRYPNQASLGQRQRTALVRALALKPKYLLLDEITSALDVEQVQVVLDHLQELREQGVGILLVTHLLNFAQRASDHIIFLDRGVVLESGGKEILEKPDHPRIKKFLSIVKAAT